MTEPMGLHKLSELRECHPCANTLCTQCHVRSPLSARSLTAPFPPDHSIPLRAGGRLFLRPPPPCRVVRAAGPALPAPRNSHVSSPAEEGAGPRRPRASRQPIGERAGESCALRLAGAAVEEGERAAWLRLARRALLTNTQLRPAPRPRARQSEGSGGLSGVVADQWGACPPRRGGCARGAGTWRAGVARRAGLRARRVPILWRRQRRQRQRRSCPNGWRRRASRAPPCGGRGAAALWPPSRCWCCWGWRRADRSRRRSMLRLWRPRSGWGRPPLPPLCPLVPRT